MAVPVEGEPIAIARATGKRAKIISERLGDPQDLPGVDDTRRQIARDLTPVVRRYLEEVRAQAEREMHPLELARRTIVQRQREERSALRTHQSQRTTGETKERAARLRRGFLGLWDRLTGRHSQTLERNAQEAKSAARRDQLERKQLVEKQNSERQRLQVKIRAMRKRHRDLEAAIYQEIATLEKQSIKPLREVFSAQRPRPNRRREQGPSFEP